MTSVFLLSTKTYKGLFVLEKYLTYSFLLLIGKNNRIISDIWFAEFFFHSNEPSRLIILSTLLSLSLWMMCHDSLVFASRATCITKNVKIKKRNRLMFHLVCGSCSFEKKGLQKLHAVQVFKTS